MNNKRVGKVFKFRFLLQSKKHEVHKLLKLSRIGLESMIDYLLVDRKQLERVKAGKRVIPHGMHRKWSKAKLYVNENLKYLKK